MKPVSEKTRKEDEKIRQELEHVDLEKLKAILKPLAQAPAKTKAGGTKKP
jgi:hypothetical protein